MKFLFGVSLLLLAILRVSSSYRDHKDSKDPTNCPTSPDTCAYTRQWDPVCSTQGCTYSNMGHLECAGGDFWYEGECGGSKNYE